MQKLVGSAPLFGMLFDCLVNLPTCRRIPLPTAIDTGNAASKKCHSRTHRDTPETRQKIDKHLRRNKSWAPHPSEGSVSAFVTERVHKLLAILSTQGFEAANFGFAVANQLSCNGVCLVPFRWRFTLPTTWSLLLEPTCGPPTRTHNITHEHTKTKTNTTTNSNNSANSNKILIIVLIVRNK